MADQVLEAVRDPVTGRFAPRDANDMRIGQVLEQSRSAKAKAAPVEKKEEPKPKAEPPADTKEANAYLHTFVFGEEPPKEDEAATKAKTDAEAAEKAKKEAAEKAAAEKPKPKPTAKATPTPALSADQIAAATAEAVARVIKPEAKSDVKPELPKLSPKNEKRLTVLAKMEELNPDEYKGISNRYRETVKKLETYRNEWLSKNPGKNFLEDDAEHEQFFAGNDVDWDDEDYMDAAAQIQAEKLVAPEREKAAKLQAEIDRRERLNSPETAQAIGADQTKRAIALWKHFGDDHDGVVKPDGTIDNAKMETLRKADPIAFAFRLQAAKDFNLEVAELYKLFPPDGKPLLPYNPKNPVHVAMEQFAAGMEQALLQQPKDKQLDAQGRPFLPLDQYLSQPADQQKRYWTLTRNDILRHRQKVLAEQTETLIATKRAELEQLAPLAGYTKANGAAAQPAAEKAKEQPVVVPAEKKPESPSAGGESKLAASRSAAANDAATGSKSFFTDL